MIQPTPRAVTAFVAGVPVALLPVWLGASAAGAWFAYTAVLCCAMAYDAWRTPAPSRFRIQLHAPPLLFIGDPEVAEVDIDIDGEGESDSDPFVMHALLDTSGPLADLPIQQVTMGRDRHGVWRRPLHATRRGAVTLDALWLRWYGPLGLVRRQARWPLAHALAVVPNTRAVRVMALRFFGAREHRAGLKLEQFIGDGSEFDALREYTPGYDTRAIDWKASAKHRTLLVRDFRAERNHQVVLAVDCGHLMRERLHTGPRTADGVTGAGVPRLDHAINASLQLAYMALRTGDQVGLFGFDAGVNTWLPPRSGVRHFPVFERRAGELDYRTAETNFTLGFTALQTNLKRRSLVVVFTEFVDTVTAELMIDNVQRLTRRHLVVFVALQDPLVESLALGAPISADALHRAVVAEDLRRERELVLARLRRLGVHVVDTSPEQMNVQLLNRYLDIRRRELV